MTRLNLCEVKAGYFFESILHIGGHGSVSLTLISMQFSRTSSFSGLSLVPWVMKLPLLFFKDSFDACFDMRKTSMDCH